MKTPFINDPFSIVAIAFSKLYPNKEYKAGIDSLYYAKDGNKETYGYTEFIENEVPTIVISGRIAVVDAVEVFAHELSRVAVGEHHNYDAEWEKAFDAIFNEYNKIYSETVESDVVIDE